MSAKRKIPSESGHEAGDGSAKKPKRKDEEHEQKRGKESKEGKDSKESQESKQNPGPRTTIAICKAEDSNFTLVYLGVCFLVNFDVLKTSCKLFKQTSQDKILNWETEREFAVTQPLGTADALKSFLEIIHNPFKAPLCELSCEEVADCMILAKYFGHSDLEAGLLDTIEYLDDKLETEEDLQAMIRLARSLAPKLADAPTRAYVRVLTLLAMYFVKAPTSTKCGGRQDLVDFLAQDFQVALDILFLQTHVYSWLSRHAKDVMNDEATRLFIAKYRSGRSKQ